MKQTKSIKKEKYVDLLTIVVKDQSTLDLNRSIFNRLDKNSLMNHLVERSGPDRYEWIDYVLNSYSFDLIRKLFVNQKPTLIFNQFFDTYTKEFNKKQFHETMKELIV
jgi:hypothetical protein